MNSFIPVCEPYLNGNELKYITEAVKSGWISSSGDYITQFESNFSHYCGVNFGITTTNGTTALHLALLSLGIKPSDEVIIPDFTMAATLFAVLYCQAKPIFVDALKDTWNMDVNQVEAKITAKTKAIIPVHIYGHPVDMDPLLQLTKKYKLAMVEDAAEAHGALYKGKKCGSLGDINCFSFYANKIITTGEGGMVVTKSNTLAEKAKYYRNLCFPLDGTRSYQHADLGYNYRFTNLQAAIGLAQLEKIDEYIEARRFHAKLYNILLSDIPGIQLPVERPDVKNVYWMFGILIDQNKFGMKRDELMNQLKNRGIDSRLFFSPMHSQKVLKKYGFTERGNYPISQQLSENGLYLPSGSNLTEKEITYIANTIKQIHTGKI